MNPHYQETKEISADSLIKEAETLQVGDRFVVVDSEKRIKFFVEDDSFPFLEEGIPQDQVKFNHKIWVKLVDGKNVFYGSGLSSADAVFSAVTRAGLLSEQSLAYLKTTFLFQP